MDVSLTRLFSIGTDYLAHQSEYLIQPCNTVIAKLHYLLIELGE